MSPRTNEPEDKVGLWICQVFFHSDVVSGRQRKRLDTDVFLLFFFSPNLPIKITLTFRCFSAVEVCTSFLISILLIVDVLVITNVHTNAFKIMRIYFPLLARSVVNAPFR